MVVLTAIVLSAETGSTNFDTAMLSPVRLPSSHPKVVVLRDSRRASAATCARKKEEGKNRGEKGEKKDNSTSKDTRECKTKNEHDTCVQHEVSTTYNVRNKTSTTEWNERPRKETESRETYFRRRKHKHSHTHENKTHTHTLSPTLRYMRSPGTSCAAGRSPTSFPSLSL